MNPEKTPDNYGGLFRKYSSYKNSEVVILPVPFDLTCTWGTGAAKGPRAIIEASKNMELYDIETESEVYHKGIHTAKGITSKEPAQLADKVYKKVSGLINDGKFTVVLGGEHTVSAGSIKAHAERFDNLSILHLDAHSDRRDSYDGTEYSHACVMARAKECAPVIVSAGIRSMDSSELGTFDKKDVFYASEIIGSRDWIRKVVSRLSPNVYVTTDLDVLDPSIMPSTGTPEPGGLGWYDLMNLFDTLSKKKNIVGFDVVELSPIKTIKAPDFLAAKLVYKLLSLKFHSQI